MGLGMLLWDFDDGTQGRRQTTLSLPLGVGVKYRHDDNFALRMEFQDIVSLGDRTGSDAVHTLALMFGAEFRFGGSRPSYDYWYW